jgi:hypothetical protein
VIAPGSTDVPGASMVVSNRSYFVRGSVFTKVGVADPAAEFRKAQALFAIAADCGFDAPAPISADPASGIVTYTFIPDLRSIRVLYLKYMSSPSRDPATLGVFREAGRALARIHARLRLEAPADWTMTPVFERALRKASQGSVAPLLSAPRAAAHCDYGFSNVNFVERDGNVRLVVLDASANGFTTFEPNLQAPRYLDVANFATCIEGLVPARWYARIRWSRLPELRDAFVSGYEAESTMVIDRGVLAAAVYATAASYFRFKFRSQPLAALALHVLFNRFKGNAAIKR